MTTVFPASPDWTDPVRETVSYATNILTAYNDSEQRIPLRFVPNRTIEFRLTSLDADEMAAVEALIWSGQQDPFLVPVWWDQAELQSTVNAAGSVLSIDTTNKEFVQGGQVLLWTGFFSWEVRTITSITSTALGVDALVSTWKAGTLVVPLVTCLLPQNVSLSRLARFAHGGTIAFERVVVPGTPPTPLTMTQYRGYDVLAWEPIREDSSTETWGRSLDVLRAPAGMFAMDDRGGTPILTRNVHHVMETKTLSGLLKQFFYRRQGAYLPFWMPTWTDDLTLTQNAPSTGTTIRIRDVGYTQLYAADHARQHVAMILPDATFVMRQVTGAVDNGDGTETLTLHTTHGVSIAKTTLVSFLVFGRLVSDTATMEWVLPSVSTAAFDVIELPREVP